MKTHAIKRTTQVTIQPEESFIEKLSIVNNRQLSVHMKSVPDAYYVLDIVPRQAREIVRIAKEGGSLGTYWNSQLRSLPQTKVEL